MAVSIHAPAKGATMFCPTTGSTGNVSIHAPAKGATDIDDCPAVILHELAHAYHDQVLGFDEPRIKTASDKAMKAGICDKVLLFNGQKIRHYAATGHKEYFAEGTEAYFYRNDFYPFVAAELRQHDPAAFALMQKIWGPLEP